ncbi:hypothetical protein I3760_11G205200 [Carya illinoinensis]|nr:hypothetical protein I3760_11G205200 [Carya illinoinensis]
MFLATILPTLIWWLLVQGPTAMKKVQDLRLSKLQYPMCKFWSVGCHMSAGLCLNASTPIKEEERLEDELRALDLVLGTILALPQTRPLIWMTSRWPACLSERGYSQRILVGNVGAQPGRQSHQSLAMLRKQLLRAL